MNEWDDFYNEPSEFEQQVDELKDSLMGAVKKEFVEEMDRLKKENAELQGVRQNFEEIKRSYEQKERALDSKAKILESDVLYKVRKERLSSLMKDFEILLYKADYKSELAPKCDKCDKDRRVHYETPLGKEAHETCNCKVSILTYSPVPFVADEFRINERGTGIRVWYKFFDRSSGDEDYASYDSSSISNDKLYTPDMKYEDVSPYQTLFSTAEGCQAYCNWKNSNKEVTQ